MFALGTVLYEALSGMHPFGRPTANETARAILEHAPAPVAGAVPDVPALLEQVVAKLLAKDPDARYQSAHEVHTDPAQVARTRGAVLVPAASGLGGRRRRWPRWAIAAAAVALVGGGSWVATRFHGSPMTALAFQERDWLPVADSTTAPATRCSIGTWRRR